MSRTNETRHIEWRKRCRWNDDKCRYECEELIYKGICDKDLFGTLVIVNVNLINHAILENI